ncbi:hypothetical protein ACP70R_014245 [Stipagrostis hirtigluma subsp. patula]
MASLPDDVFVEILRRLPVRSVGRCRAVCRDWNAATSHPSFDRVLAKRPATVAKVSPSHFYFHLAQTWVVAAVFELFRGRWHPDNVHKVAASTVGLSLCCASTSSTAPTTTRLLSPAAAASPSRPWSGSLRSGTPIGARATAPSTCTVTCTGWCSRRAPGGRRCSCSTRRAQEKFRCMAAPVSRALDVATARLRLLSGDNLCILVLATRPPALEMWVLDDYTGPRSWRLRDKIRMVLMDGTDLSPKFAAAAAEVELVEGVEEGEEILLRLDGWAHAYSFRHKWWRKVSVTQSATLLAHRESVMPREISFGEASQVIPRTPPRSRRRG